MRIKLIFRGVKNNLLLYHMKEKELIELMLPEGMLTYFDIIKVENSNESFVFHLAEKNTPPDQYKDHKLESKGFYDAVTIQDFPLRGKASYLQVKRRRWLDLDTGNTVMRDWNIVANGTRMTKEFASFLKELNRYYSSKH